MSKFGTLNVLEDLAADTNVVAGREEEIARRFQQALDVHNQLFDGMVSDLATITGQSQLPYGASDGAIIQELDEWAAADASKAAAFGSMGLPLRIYGGTIQWTRTYFDMVSAAEIAAQLNGFALADIQMFQKAVKTALFKSTNTVNYFDRLQTKLTYDLKALLNADGQAIPVSQNGVTFSGATHTHYLANATLTAAFLQSEIDTVIEHGVDGKVVVYIARGDEATVRGLTGFAPYLDTRVTVSGANQIGTGALDTMNPDNRAIGVFGGAEIWVKPWIPTSYQAVLDIGGGVKPLGIRTRTGSLTGPGAFGLKAEHEHYPLRAQHLGREYGVSVVNRHKAAVGYSAGAAYATPVF